MRMKSIILSAGLAALAAAPAHAAFSKWEGDPSVAPGASVHVDEVRLGEELSAHVEDIGQRDLDRLLSILRSEVEAELARRGVLDGSGAGAGAVELDLILVEATPNRPTFAQLGGEGDWNWDDDRRGRRPLSNNLSLSSFGTGGGEIVGVFTGADGGSLGEVSFRYEERDIEQAQFAATWTDVHRTIDQFAIRLGEKLAGDLTQ